MLPVGLTRVWQKGRTEINAATSRRTEMEGSGRSQVGSLESLTFETLFCQTGGTADKCHRLK
jgi:hypothetical protein